MLTVLTPFPMDAYRRRDRRRRFVCLASGGLGLVVALLAWWL